MEIYGTLGPSCRTQPILTQMFQAGMTGMRLNLSHVTLQESEGLIQTYGQAALAAGCPPHLVIDLQGPELRVGPLPQAVTLLEGEAVTLGETGIPVPPLLLEALSPGAAITFDDGAMLVEVVGCDGAQARCKVLRGGQLSGRKSIGAPELAITPPTLTETDLQNLKVAARYGVAGLLQPFVRGREDLFHVKQILRELGLDGVQVIAKIENQAGLARLPEIIAEADMVCIARGDLGNHIPLWALPRTQKEIARACNRAGRPFLVVTQMLHSMMQQPVPTRAEVSDIFNAVLDGASALMLTGETAVGRYPVEAIAYMAKTAGQALAYLNNDAAPDGYGPSL